MNYFVDLTDSCRLPDLSHRFLVLIQSFFANLPGVSEGITVLTELGWSLLRHLETIPDLP